MQRQYVVNNSGLSSFQATSLMAPHTLQFVNISPALLANTSNQFVECLYAQTSVQNIYLNELQDKDFFINFHSHRYQLSNLKINALALNRLNPKIIEAIVFDYLHHPPLNLTTLILSNLDESALANLYDLLVYFILRGKTISVTCTNDIPNSWHLKFYELSQHINYEANLAKEFCASMLARFKDRHYYLSELNQSKIALKKEKSHQQELQNQITAITGEMHALKAQNALLLEQRQKSKSEYLTKEIELIDEVKTLKMTLDNLKSTLTIHEAKANAEKNKLKLEIQQVENTLAIQTRDIHDIQTKYPALFSAVQLPNYSSSIGKELVSTRKLIRSELDEASESTEADDAKDDDINSNSFTALLRAAKTLTPKLKQKLIIILQSFLAGKIFQSKIPSTINEYIRQQLQIAETIIAGENSFYTIPDGQAEAVFHYVAYILCNLPDTQPPFPDQQHERTALLQTITNMFSMIETLHKSFITDKQIINDKNAEIAALRINIAKTYIPNHYQLFQLSQPRQATTLFSASAGGTKDTELRQTKSLV